MTQHDEGFARHAAVLQLVAEQLRGYDASSRGMRLEQCSLAIESVAAALICAEGNPDSVPL